MEGRRHMEHHLTIVKKKEQKKKSHSRFLYSAIIDALTYGSILVLIGQDI